LDGVQAESFRGAVRFFLAELSRTKHCEKSLTMFGPGQLRQKEAHRHTETCYVFFMEFLAFKIKGFPKRRPQVARWCPQVPACHDSAPFSSPKPPSVANKNATVQTAVIVLIKDVPCSKPVDHRNLPHHAVAPFSNEGERFFVTSIPLFI